MLLPLLVLVFLATMARAQEQVPTPDLSAALAAEGWEVLDAMEPPDGLKWRICLDESRLNALRSGSIRLKEVFGQHAQSLGPVFDGDPGNDEVAHVQVHPEPSGGRVSLVVLTDNPNSGFVHPRFLRRMYLVRKSLTASEYDQLSGFCMHNR